MARRGRFGRLPRVAPSLTSTIIAISREFQAERDKNIVDAWQHGGSFEGKPATDERLLAYWRERLTHVSKKDPLYDTYSNAVYQFEYTIAESKMSTKYAQGKATNGQMASFYLTWAKKVPKNSEFYRVLQRDAAQFTRAARARGAAGAARAKEKAYVDAQNATEAKYEKVGEYLTDTLTNIAKAHALIGMDSNVDVRSFDPSDPAAMQKLISEINNPESTGSDAVLYHDPLTGKAVTGRDIVSALKKLDPHFNGAVTVSYFTQALRNQITGESERLKRAQDTGHKTDTRNLMGLIPYTSEIGREANAWPIEQSYQDVRNLWLHTSLNPLSTPDEQLAAWQTYAQALTGLANDARTDDATRTRLLAEVSGDGSVSSLAEDFTGLGSPDHSTTEGGSKGDIADTHYDIERYLAMQEAVASGDAVWAMGITKDGVFTPVAGGREVGAAAPSEILASSSAGAVPVVVPQAGGQPITVWTSGIPITTSATDTNGQKLHYTSNPDVGTAYDVTVNGQTVRVYSYKGSDGHTYYTHDAPWGQGVIARNDPDGKGIILDVSAYVPTDASQLTADSPFRPDASDPSSLVYDPSLVVYTSDPARAAAGPDPLTDSYSPTIAAILSTPDGYNTLTQLGGDAGFRKQIDDDAHKAAGFQQDQDGNWVGGDAAAYGRFADQNTIVTNIGAIKTNVGSIVDGVIGLFSKTTTAPTFADTARAPATLNGPRNIDKIEGQDAALPSDQVQGTPFEALGGVFQQGINLFKKLTGDTQNPLSIKTEGQLTVPSAPNVTVTPPPIAPIPTPPSSVTTTAPPPSVTTTAPPPSYGPPPGSNTHPRAF